MQQQFSYTEKVFLIEEIYYKHAKSEIKSEKINTDSASQF